MSEIFQFNGFPERGVKFFVELAENNNKMWFNQHKNEYENDVLAPARAFVFEMGKRLKKISPRVNADPRINKSLFKIHRDTRFSQDKTPFKTHLGIMFWEGAGPRMECSCYYFHLAPPNLMLGVGIYMFPKPLLEQYRSSVVHPKYGKALIKAINQGTQDGTFKLGGRYYKKTPRGFDPNHEHAEYLLYRGLHVGTESNIPEELYSSQIIGYCFEKFQKLAPVHNWLVAMTERVNRV
ncbi:MAG: DUF2461 domain-containing protein [bacterium]